MYVRELLATDNLTDCRPVGTPLEEDSMPTVAETTIPREDIHSAQCLVGALLWLASQTRVDLAYTVHVFSSLMLSNPLWVVQSSRRTLRYLSGTQHVGLRFSQWKEEHYEAPTYASRFNDMRLRRGRPLHTTTRDSLLHCYSDASFAPNVQRDSRDDPSDSGAKSVTGLLIMLGGNTIAWRSQRQSTVSSSTMESEITAQLSGTQVAVGIRDMLIEMGVPNKLRLNCDSTSALDTISAQFTSRNRHVGVRVATIGSYLCDDDQIDAGYKQSRDVG
jgi:hypothetical protein